MGTVILLCSCTHRVSTTINKTYPPLDYREKVVVLDITREEPENAEMLGEIKLGDTGFSIKCGYDLAIEKAKMEARKSGGNVVKIIDHRPPSAFGSTCHRITAKILRVKEVEKLVRAEEGDLLDIDHAIFYVYRPDGRGFLVNYDLYLGDSVICRVSSNYGAKIKIYKDGLNTLWASTEAKTEIPINVEIGKEYFIRCGIKNGIMVGRPSIELVRKSIGEGEYHSVKATISSKVIIITKEGLKIVGEITREDEDKVYFDMIVKGNKVHNHLKKERIKSIEYVK